APLPDAARREDEGGVVRRLEQRQQTPRQDERRVDVHVHDALPFGDVVVLDRAAVAEYPGVVHEAVQPSVTGLDLLGQMLILRPLGALEVELCDRRLGADLGDLVMQLLEGTSISAVKQYGRAEPGGLERE